MMGWGARDGGPCTPSGPLTASPAAGGPAGAEPGSGDGCLGFWLHRRGLPRRRKRRRKRRPGNRPRATGAKRRGSACRVTMPTPPGGGGHYEEGRCQLEAKRRQPGWSQLRPTSANKLARIGPRLEGASWTCWYNLCQPAAGSANFRATSPQPGEPCS